MFSGLNYFSTNRRARNTAAPGQDISCSLHSEMLHTAQRFAPSADCGRFRRACMSQSTQWAWCAVVLVPPRGGLRPSAGLAHSGGEMSGSVGAPLSAPSNLGVLQRVIELDPPATDAYGMQRISAESLAERGLYLDAGSLGPSALLLLLLLALTFSRFFGLDHPVHLSPAAWKDCRDPATAAQIPRT